MTLVKGLLCQLLALCLALLLNERMAVANGLNHLLWLQAPIAALLSGVFRQPVWWLPIHLLFLPLAGWLLHYGVPAWVYLCLFGVMLAVFWGTASGDVPLFLSSNAVSTALRELVVEQQADSLADLGAGIGSVVVPLARHCPYLNITAVEHAPLPWLILTWRCRGLTNVNVLRNNLWHCDLSRYAIVFAFLSPAAMPRLSRKCANEMPRDGVLVSSCFEMPNWPLAKMTQLKDRAGTRLFVYRCPETE